MKTPNKPQRKKKTEPLVKRVILHPGETRSRHDGDTHFIGGRQLANLYGVLSTDIVITFDYRNQIPEDRKYHEGWIELYPKSDGKYEDIHQFDFAQLKNIKFFNH